MVLDWNFKQVVKKKFIVSSQDKEDWLTFTKRISKVRAKKFDYLEQNLKINKFRKLDLHGFSLIEANRIVKKFIIDSFDSGCKKLLIITGKGLRSKSSDNPYVSKKLSVLKYSVPDYIKNDQNLIDKISKISKAELKDGGEGAIYIFLKNRKKL